MKIIENKKHEGSHCIWHIRTPGDKLDRWGSNEWVCTNVEAIKLHFFALDSHGFAPITVCRDGYKCKIGR